MSNNLMGAPCKYKVSGLGPRLNHVFHGKVTASL